ncbi:MAG: hypothetical protein JXQ91_06945 [Vannielia sp.]|uniref:hypothetical protein n=1 Tax=Rhodobacterales TaxID=204455 RepID=UPI0020962058|nr:hypothetical protein [Oceanicola sp. 502str15]MCO6384206.1 hypothetical protein [Oceanicola sp. 502str15]
MKHLFPLAIAALLSGCMTEPEPLPTGEITWEQARALFKACKVETAFQDHQRNVSLTLIDGSTVTTVEPGLDDIFHTDKLAPGCPDIGIITE